MTKKMTKHCKKSIALALVAAFCVSSYPNMHIPMDVKAETIGQLQSENRDSEKKKEEAQNIVDNLSIEHDNIVAAIAELDEKVKGYQERIVELNNQKDAIEEEIKGALNELEEAKVAENDQYEAMKLRIQYAYENDDMEYLDTIFSSTDIAEVVNDAEYAEQVYNYDQTMLDDLVEVREEIAEKEASLEKDLEQIKKIEEEVNGDLEAVQVMIEGKETQLANYTESIEEYQALVAQYQKEIDERDAKIAAIEAEIRKREQEALAAGRPIQIFYTGGGFQWPVANGYFNVSSPYGPRWGTIHGGIDIPCPLGTPILAGEAGTVIASYLSSSAGEYIVIDHGGGVCTEYMHNTTRLVSVGDVVSRGQVIAYSGNTGFSTGPHCHFGVRINGSRVDPAPYL